MKQHEAEALERVEHDGTFQQLFKPDHPRAIDRLIDYFGSTDTTPHEQDGARGSFVHASSSA